MARHDEFPSQCGITIIHGLNGDNLESQVNEIEQAFDDGCAMVMISDTMDNEGWAETKAVADRGPIKTNPNSGNRITYWTILRKHLTALKAKLAAQNKALKSTRKIVGKQSRATDRYKF